MKEDFLPVLRFIVTSDIHYHDRVTVERERFERGIQQAYAYAETQEYPNLDALFVVGDFSNHGTLTQMTAFHDSLQRQVRPGTEVTISVASHEFNLGKHEEAEALDKLDRIFHMQPDVHKIIRGFHFISVSTTNGCKFDQAKKDWIAKELKAAAADDPQKPIFFFQHPHLSGTVYGSSCWGECSITPILMDYPQIIDFSGHSHAPINDPRSIHQKYFTSLGTGTFSYFELDEFDKIYGTFPPGKEIAAQMLIVEADSQNRVRVYPYDVITGNFFPQVWKIDTPSDPSTFLYTDKRYRTASNPYFKEDACLSVEETGPDFCTIRFDQALMEGERVNSYEIVLREQKTGRIVKQMSVWSGYYFYEMPDHMSVTINGLSPKTEYHIQIHANSFWNTQSQKPLNGFCKTTD